MSAPDKRLRKIEYARSYTATNDQEIHLVGSSRWIRDLELILENEWTNLKCYVEPTEAANALVDLKPKAVLIEPTPYGEDTSRWIESCVQNDIQALVIAPDSINQFEWIRASRKAAAHNFGSSLFSADSRTAALELGDFFMTSDILTSTKHLSDVAVVHFAQLGYSLATNASSDLARELFTVIAEEFIIPSDDVAKALTLAENSKLWKLPKAIDSDLHRAFARLERDLQEKDASRILTLTLSTIANFESNSFSEEIWNKSLQNCGFGMLSRRKLATKYLEITNLIHSMSNLRTLKIA